MNEILFGRIKTGSLPAVLAITIPIPAPAFCHSPTGYGLKSSSLGDIGGTRIIDFRKLKSDVIL